MLAKLLRVHTKLFSVAGTKDKRGVTVQQVCAPACHERCPTPTFKMMCSAPAQVTAFKLNPSRLAGLNPRLRGIRVGNFEFVPAQLRLGDLQGNRCALVSSQLAFETCKATSACDAALHARRFDIILRNITADSSEAVSAAAAALKQSGFINYFGLQRFGTGAVPTHRSASVILGTNSVHPWLQTHTCLTCRIGQALLCGQWQKAVRLLLTPSDTCVRSEQIEACRLYLDEGDVNGALRLIPRFLVAEPTLLQVGMFERRGRQSVIVKPQHRLPLAIAGPEATWRQWVLERTVDVAPQSADHIHPCVPELPGEGSKGCTDLSTGVLEHKAVSKFPDTGCNANPRHALQWNAAASHRVQTYGAARPVAGDLVLCQTPAQRAAARNRNSCQEAPQADAGLHALSPGQEDDGEGSATLLASPTEDVHVVSHEEAAAGAWRIEDVVLPLPGRHVRYPEHATAGVYDELAAHDGVSLASSPHGCKEFSIEELSGAYRHLLHSLQDLEVGSALVLFACSTEHACTGSCSLSLVHSSRTTLLLCSMRPSVIPTPTRTWPSPTSKSWRAVSCRRRWHLMMRRVAHTWHFVLRSRCHHLAMPPC